MSMGIPYKNIILIGALVSLSFCGSKRNTQAQVAENYKMGSAIPLYQISYTSHTSGRRFKLTGR